MLGAALLSGAMPAESAVRGSLVEALVLNRFACLAMLALPLCAQDARQIGMGARERPARTRSGMCRRHIGGQRRQAQGVHQTLDLSGSAGQSKAVLRFTAPAEVKGVALLIHNHPDRASDQWMWTPAVARERRIASRTGAHVASAPTSLLKIWKSAT